MASNNYFVSYPKYQIFPVYILDVLSLQMSKIESGTLFINIDLSSTGSH